MFNFQVVSLSISLPRQTGNQEWLFTWAWHYWLGNTTVSCPDLQPVNFPDPPPEPFYPRSWYQRGYQIILRKVWYHHTYDIINLWYHRFCRQPYDHRSTSSKVLSSTTSLVDQGWYGLTAALNFGVSTDLKGFKLHTDYSVISEQISRFQPVGLAAEIKFESKFKPLPQAVIWQSLPNEGY